MPQLVAKYHGHLAFVLHNAYEAKIANHGSILVAISVYYGRTVYKKMKFGFVQRVLFQYLVKYGAQKRINPLVEQKAFFVQLFDQRGIFIGNYFAVILTDGLIQLVCIGGCSIIKK